MKKIALFLCTVLITVFSLGTAVAADPKISLSSASLIVSKDNVEIP